MTASYTETARAKLRALLDTSKVSDIDAGFQALAEDIDAKMAVYSEGTEAERPAPAYANRLFYATDTKRLWHDTGSAWAPVYVSPEAIDTSSVGALGEPFLYKTNEELTPHATRPTLVTYYPNFTGNFQCQVTVNGAQVINTAVNGENNGIPFGVGFIVPAGMKWKSGNSNGPATYTFL